MISYTPNDFHTIKLSECELCNIHWFVYSKLCFKRNYQNSYNSCKIMIFYAPNDFHTFQLLEYKLCNIHWFVYSKMYYEQTHQSYITRKTARFSTLPMTSTQLNSWNVSFAISIDLHIIHATIWFRTHPMISSQFNYLNINKQYPLICLILSVFRANIFI